MITPVIHTSAEQRLRGIHDLSAAYNRKIAKPHMGQLLELIRHHAQEIPELFQARDPHFLVETGDLAVLCFEVLLENDASIDATLSRCFERYEKKLSSLLKGLKKT